MQPVPAQLQSTSAVWPFAGRAQRGSLVSQACLLGEQRGVVFVEYVIVLVLVSALGVAGIIPLGVALSHYFKAQQTVLSLPFP